MVGLGLNRKDITMVAKIFISHAQDKFIEVSPEDEIVEKEIAFVLFPGDNLVIKVQQLGKDPEFVFEISSDNAILLARQILAVYDTKQQQNTIIF